MLPQDTNSINEQVLESLVINGVPESRTLEYKKEIHLKKDGDKKEFLADVSSFANVSGGDLIVGIECDSATKLPIRLQGVNESDIDGYMLQMESLIRNGISPRLNVTTHPVPLQNGNTALLIRIPNSWNKPHRVELGREKFYTRGSNGKYSMDREELRRSFLSANSLEKDIQYYLENRILTIQANETYVPLSETTIAVYHLIPTSAFLENRKLEITSANDYRLKLKPLNTSGWNNQYTIEGIMAFSGAGHGNYMHLSRTGIMEATSYLPFYEKNNDGEVMLAPDYLEEDLNKFLLEGLTLLKEFAVEAPVYAFATLIGIKNKELYVSRRRGAIRHKTHHKDVLQLPPILVNSYDDETDKLITPCIDILWNAYGFAGKR